MGVLVLVPVQGPGRLWKARRVGGGKADESSGLIETRRSGQPVVKFSQQPHKSSLMLSQVKTFCFISAKITYDIGAIVYIYQVYFFTIILLHYFINSLK